MMATMTATRRSGVGVVNVLGVPLATPNDWAAYFLGSIGYGAQADAADPATLDADIVMQTTRAMGPNADPAQLAANIQATRDMAAKVYAQVQSGAVISWDSTSNPFNLNIPGNALMWIVGGVAAVWVGAVILQKR